MFASERVHMGMQLHAPRLRFAKVWGLAHRGREFLQNLSETEEGLTGDSKLLQTLERGVIIYSLNGLQLKGTQ